MTSSNDNPFSSSADEEKILADLSRTLSKDKFDIVAIPPWAILFGVILFPMMALIGRADGAFGLVFMLMISLTVSGTLFLLWAGANLVESFAERGAPDLPAVRKEMANLKLTTVTQIYPLNTDDAQDSDIDAIEKLFEDFNPDLDGYVLEAEEDASDDNPQEEKPSSFPDPPAYGFRKQPKQTNKSVDHLSKRNWFRRRKK